ncbi:hypothetical protein AB669_10600 [Pedobacter sp. BMA]|nr:hypothetical protein AB669_10600 [Pedobacter sp. BMA]
MKVMVKAIEETDFLQDQALAKIMNSRLKRAATELQDFHLVLLSQKRFAIDELLIHISYNSKYKIRYHILTAVPANIEGFVAERCGRLGYILWKSMVPAHY